MEIIPAIDLRDGKVVRLAQGDYDRETRYEVDPIEVAARYRADGAKWLHVVDLDGARSGTSQNTELITRLAQGGLRIQTGGGVRSRRDVETLLNSGASRVVVGSVAIREPETVEHWLRDFDAERLCIALDTRCVDGVWTLTSAGWTQTESNSLDELAMRYAEIGARHLLSTDIDRDGMLNGPNLELYRHLVASLPSLSVQASGGVRDRSDVAALAVTGAGGVILGRSLLEGRLTVGEALAC